MATETYAGKKSLKVTDSGANTEIKFVRIDDDGNPLPISDRVKKRYSERIRQFGRGLLSFEELENLNKS